MSVSEVAVRIFRPPLDVAREQRPEVAVAPSHRDSYEGMQSIEANAPGHDDAAHHNRLDAVERDLETGDLRAGHLAIILCGTPARP